MITGALFVASLVIPTTLVGLSTLLKDIWLLKCCPQVRPLHTLLVAVNVCSGFKYKQRFYLCITEYVND